MKKINLAITGCMGRMGQQFIKSAKSDKNFNLVALTENRIINKKISGIKPELNTEKAFKNTNVIIDFTVPKCTFEVLKIASKLKKRVVIGTTGFTKKDENLIKKENQHNITSEKFKILLDTISYKWNGTTKVLQPMSYRWLVQTLKKNPEATLEDIEKLVEPSDRALRRERMAKEGPIAF